MQTGDFGVDFGSSVVFATNSGLGGYDNLEITNGTASGTQTLGQGLFTDAGELASFNGNVLFNAYDGNGNVSIWLTDGTTTGTSELTSDISIYDGNAGYPVTLGNLEIFSGMIGDHSGGLNELYVTNGTAANNNHRSYLKLCA